MKKLVSKSKRINYSLYNKYETRGGLGLDVKPIPFVLECSIFITVTPFLSTSLRHMHPGVNSKNYPLPVIYKNLGILSLISSYNNFQY